MKRRPVSNNDRVLDVMFKIGLECTWIACEMRGCTRVHVPVACTWISQPVCCVRLSEVSWLYLQQMSLTLLLWDGEWLSLRTTVGWSLSVWVPIDELWWPWHEWCVPVIALGPVLKVVPLIVSSATVIEPAISFVVVVVRLRRLRPLLLVRWVWYRECWRRGSVIRVRSSGPAWFLQPFFFHLKHWLSVVKGGKWFLVFDNVDDVIVFLVKTVE